MRHPLTFICLPLNAGDDSRLIARCKLFASSSGWPDNYSGRSLAMPRSWIPLLACIFSRFDPTFWTRILPKVATNRHHRQQGLPTAWFIGHFPPVSGFSRYSRHPSVEEATRKQPRTPGLFILHGVNLLRVLSLSRNFSHHGLVNDGRAVNREAISFLCLIPFRGMRWGESARLEVNLNLMFTETRPFVLQDIYSNHVKGFPDLPGLFVQISK